jgi:type IV pilus assembly protein PilM
MASRKVIGLDFGSSNIRAIEVELDKNDNISSVEAVYKQPIPTQVITNGNIVSYSALVSNLKELISRNGIKEKEVFISINGDSIVSRNLLGIESEKDEVIFRKTLPYKIKDLVPIEWADNEYSYHTINEYVDEDKRAIMRDIIFVAMTKANIKLILTAVHEAGLQPYVIDIAPLGILRASLATGDIEGKRVACIDIGGDTTNIIIHKDGYPEYVRTITGVGGNIINTRISNDLHFPSHEAEIEKFKALSRQNDIAQTNNSVFGGFNVDGIDPNSREAAVAQSINLIVAQEASVIVSQVRDTFTDATFHSATIDSPIEHIFLSGAGSGLQTLSARLQNELNNIPVSYLNPFDKLASKNLKKQISDGTVIPHEYASVFGLVHRALPPVIEPAEPKVKVSKKKNKKATNTVIDTEGK